MRQRKTTLLQRRVAARGSALVCSVAALCAAPLAAHSAHNITGLTVIDPWVRVVGGPVPAAGYFILSNASAEPEVLVGVSSPDCGKLTMHQSRNVNGVESMVMVGRIPVPPHGRIVFAPSGYHLMCMAPSKSIQPGAQVPIALRFADGQQLKVRFPVRPLGGAR